MKPNVKFKKIMVFLFFALIIFASTIPLSRASANSITDDDTDGSYYFFKGGDARYWHTASCSLCVNGTYSYTANNYNSVGNYGLWYVREQSTYFTHDVNIPNASGATTRSAKYLLYRSGSDSTYSDSAVVNQYTTAGWKNDIFGGVKNYQSIGGYIELDDQTGETKSTTNVGFDAFRFNIQ